MRADKKESVLTVGIFTLMGSGKPRLINKQQPSRYKHSEG